MDDAKITSRVIIFTGFFMLFSMIILGIYDSTIDTEKKDIPCFDAHHNRIQGLTCTEVQPGVNAILPLAILLSIMLIMVGYVMGAWD